MPERSINEVQEAVDRLLDRLRVRGSKHIVAVFVTPQEITWVRPDCRDYAMLVTRAGQHEIGRYNSRVAREDLLGDVMHAAAQLGWFNA